MIKIYSDGCCKGNPGPGGWGALLIYNQHVKEIYGGEDYTTNNRMELLAVIEALKTIKNQSIPILVTTDSQYVKNGIQSWIHNWKRNGWKNSTGKPVKNDDLWKVLDTLVHQFSIKWNWVKGHAGVFENERADQLANLGCANKFKERVPSIESLLNFEN